MSCKNNRKESEGKTQQQQRAEWYEREDEISEDKKEREKGTKSLNETPIRYDTIRTNTNLNSTRRVQKPK